MEVIRQSALEDEMQELIAISEDRTLKPHEKYNLVEARGYSLEELEALRAKKANERGAFVHRIFLENIQEIGDKS